MELVKVMKALGDETRIRIMNLLRSGELCVCELEVLLNINQSNASRHLNRLSNERILVYYKKAQYVYYQINTKILDIYPFINEILNSELNKIEECTKDLGRLKRYKDSGISCDELKDSKNIFREGLL